VPKRPLIVTLALVGALLLPAAAANAGSGSRNVYVNPFPAEKFWAGRIDMGVDYGVSRRQPVLAMGKARILGSTAHSGWPGGRYLYYQLENGNHAGEIVYVAESLRDLKPAGAEVMAGERIAVAIPGGTGIETGYAELDGQTRAAPCYKEGRKTNSGREFARLLLHIGAEVGDDPGPGSSHPVGPRC